MTIKPKSDVSFYSQDWLTSKNRQKDGDFPNQAKFIRTLRYSLDLTQEEFAYQIFKMNKKTTLPTVAKQTISEIERGNRGITNEHIANLSISQIKEVIKASNLDFKLRMHNELKHLGVKGLP